MSVQNKEKLLSLLIARVMLVGTFDEIAVGRYLFFGLLLLTLLGLIPAAIAQKKGRNFLDWWFFGAALFPLALPMALRLESDEA